MWVYPPLVCLAESAESNSLEKDSAQTTIFLSKYEDLVEQAEKAWEKISMMEVK